MNCERSWKHGRKPIENSDPEVSAELTRALQYCAIKSYEGPLENVLISLGRRFTKFPHQPISLRSLERRWAKVRKATKGAFENYVVTPTEQAGIDYINWKVDTTLVPDVTLRYRFISMPGVEGGSRVTKTSEGNVIVDVSENTICIGPLANNEVIITSGISSCSGFGINLTDGTFGIGHFQCNQNRFGFFLDHIQKMSRIHALAATLPDYQYPAFWEAYSDRLQEVNVSKTYSQKHSFGFGAAMVVSNQGIIFLQGLGYHGSYIPVQRWNWPIPTANSTPGVENLVLTV